MRPRSDLADSAARIPALPVEAAAVAASNAGLEATDREDALTGYSFAVLCVLGMLVAAADRVDLAGAGEIGSFAKAVAASRGSALEAIEGAEPDCAPMGSFWKARELPPYVSFWT